MSMRFCGFFTRAADLSTAKQEVKRIATRASSVVFLDSRRNETTRNGWINFANAKDCEDFIREIVKNPPKNGLRFKKQGAHLKPEKNHFSLPLVSFHLDSSGWITSSRFLGRI